MLKPVKNSVIFAFLDAVHKGRFIETSASGIYIGRSQHGKDDAQAPRWARVLAVGPDVVGIKTTDIILIEPNQWTFGTELDEITIWRTTDDKVLLVRE